MANSQIVKKYTTNKICCLATNTVKTDRKIKYGSEDALCCVAKDFRAQTFLKMMQCSSEVSGTNWYHLSLTLQYISKTPAEYDFISDLIINSNEMGGIDSYDGTQTTTDFDISGNYGVLADIDAVNEAFAEKINIWGISQNDTTIFAFAEYIKEGTDPGYIQVDIYHDETWGNNTTEDLSFSSINIASLPFESASTVLSYEADTTITSSACFTEAQLCAMKRVIDNYCKSCN